MNLDNEKSSKGKFFGYLICKTVMEHLPMILERFQKRTLGQLNISKVKVDCLHLQQVVFLIIWKCLKDNLKSMPLWLL